MTANLTYYDEVLKEFYEPAVNEQLNHATFLSDKIENNTKDVSGEYAKIQCHYGRNAGIGARVEDGALPTATRQLYKTCQVKTKYNYGTIKISGPVMAATRNDRGAYVDALDSEIRGITTDMSKDINRQLWGCGYGVLGRWLATGGATSYNIQRAYTGNSAGGDTFGSTFGAKYMTEIANATPVVLTTDGTNVTAITVDATNIAVSAVTEVPASGYDTITCTDPSVTEAAGTFYVRLAALTACTTDSSNVRVEMMGLRGIVTNTDLDDIVLYDGTSRSTATGDPLQTLTVDTYAWWKANVDALAGGRYTGQRALSFKLMDKMFDTVEAKAGKDYGPDVVITTRAIRREYLELCRVERRTVNSMTLDGGWKAVEYNGIPLMIDDDAIDGEMYFLTMKDLAIYSQAPYQFMQKDGAILNRVSGYDQYEATLFRYAELGTTRRNAHGVICDLAYEV